jgi:hypothetical protein
MIRRRLPVSATVSALFLGGLLLAAGCARDEAPAAPAQAALVPRFLGCYALDIGGGHPFRLQLTDTPVGRSWVALTSWSGPGNEWHWAPRDSTQFSLEWGGIDGAMQFTVTRSPSGYTATGQRLSSDSQPAAELQPMVWLVGCDPVRAR